ncbi:MAG: HDOD domain-containing protein [bacterium]|nr:HDOD domain-containing protein [bacterium]
MAKAEVAAHVADGVLVTRANAAARAKSSLRRERTTRRSGLLAAQRALRVDSANTFMARQPLFDKRLDVVGYEILFRGGPVPNRAIIDDENQATSSVIIDTFTGVDLEDILGGKRALINLTRDLILEGIPTLLPPERVVVEVLEHTTVDDRLITALRRLRSQGYTIALDDWISFSKLRPLLPLADIVKIDIQAFDPNRLVAEVGWLGTYGVQLVAEKVETYGELRRCRRLGFDYFQGYFLSRPEVLKRTAVPPNQIETLELISLMQNPEVAIEELADIIRRDVALSYKLLRIVNSAYYSLPRHIESIKDAIVLLGTRQIGSWVSLINLAQIARKPKELTITALVRARMCELVAEMTNRHDGDAYYTVGLFSVLDALLDVPLDHALEALPLSGEVHDAVALHEGVMGRTLAGVIAYEKGDWENARIPGIDDAQLAFAFRDAVVSSDEMWARISA